MLIETFVETLRYTCAVYRASGWVHVGTTQGRGRYDTDKQYDKPKKDIWLRPLRHDPFDGIGNAHSIAKISLWSECACRRAVKRTTLSTA